MKIVEMQIDDKKLMNIWSIVEILWQFSQFIEKN